MNGPEAQAPSRSRRYAYGVLAVALAGIAMLVAFVWWSEKAIDRAIASNLEDRARQTAEAYRDKLVHALGPRDPLSAETWSNLDPALEEAFEGLPSLVGIVVRQPSGSNLAVIGPNDLRRRDFLPATERGGELAIRIADDGTSPPQVDVSFEVTATRGAVRPPVANVYLQFPRLSDLRAALFRLFQLGTVLVVIVVYLLAALAMFISRRGIRAETLEREKAVRLAAIGEVAGAIAHELRNPLNAISLSFQVIGEELRRAGQLEGARAGDLDRARAEIQKISRVVDNFVSFARLSDLTMADLDFAEVAKEAFDGLAPAAAAASVKARIEVSGGTRLRADRDKLREVLATTLSAVLDAIKEGAGTLDLVVEGGNRAVTVTIRGAADRVDSKRLSNFASSRRGWDEPVGLALTIARTWIDCHGGSVSGTERSGRAEIRIVFPKGLA